MICTFVTVEAKLYTLEMHYYKCWTHQSKTRAHMRTESEIMFCEGLETSDPSASSVSKSLCTKQVMVIGKHMVYV
jgi:hypothetical protein